MNQQVSETEETEGRPTARKPAGSRKKFQRSFIKRSGYRIMQRMLQVFFLIYFRIRVVNTGHYPESGAALICSNHQSHLDPPLVGHCCKRRLNYLARKTLFKSRFFAWSIDFLDAIPLDQNGMGIGGIKETMKRLKRGELVLIFPEGTRTSDGELKSFSGGFIVLARRSKVPLVPVGLDGAFQSWPRTRKFPLPTRIAVSIGKPITYDEYKDLDDQGVLELLRQRIEIEFEKAARLIGNRPNSRANRS